MYLNNTKYDLPRTLKDGLLVDANHRPRYWAVVWSSVFAGQLAINSRKDKLRSIEALYKHSDGLYGVGTLDAAIGKLDYDLIATLLESWFVSISNKSNQLRF